MTRNVILLCAACMFCFLSQAFGAGAETNKFLKRNIWRGIFEYTILEDKLASFKIIALARSEFSDASIVVRTDQSAQPANQIGGPMRSLSAKLFQKCLETNKLPASSIQKDLPVYETVNELRGRRISGASLWAPLVLGERGTAMEPRMDVAVKCTAADVGLPIFFVTLTDLSHVSESSSIPTELATEFSQNGLLRKHPKSGIDDMKRAYAERDVIISEDEATRELLKGLPPRFEEQLSLFENTNGPSVMEKTLSKLIDDMADAEIISTKPNPSDLLDASVLKAIADDPKLRKLAVSND
jgi:hypothetical protein